MVKNTNVFLTRKFKISFLIKADQQLKDPANADKDKIRFSTILVRTGSHQRRSLLKTLTPKFIKTCEGNRQVKAIGKGHY